MVIKVDFDLVMAVLTCNLYRLLALKLPLGYRHCTPQTPFESLLETAADIQLGPNLRTVSPRKKRNLPTPLEALGREPSKSLLWLDSVVLAQLQLCHGLAMNLVWAISEAQGALARPGAG